MAKRNNAKEPEGCGSGPSLSDASRYEQKPAGAS